MYIQWKAINSGLAKHVELTRAASFRERKVTGLEWETREVVLLPS